MKEISVIVEGGKATAGPPIGPALGPLGINAGKVVAEINEQTKAFAGVKVPVKIIVDPKSKTYTIEVGSPPVAELLKKKANLSKGSGNAWKENPAGNVSLSDVVEIAKSIKDKSLGKTLKSTAKEVIGTAQSLGITVEGKKPKDLIREIDEGKHETMLK